MSSSAAPAQSLPASSLNSLASSAHELGQEISRLEGQQQLLEGQVADALTRAETAEAKLGVLEQAQAVLQQMESSWRRNFEERLAGLVSHGLTAVFGEEITITIESEIKRDATSMRLILKQGDVTLGNIVDGTGGSIVSMLGVLLRILLVVSTPGMRRLVVLDEPFKAVAPDHLPAVGQLLRELSTRLGLQMVIVSHEAELVDVADVAYEVVKKGSKATVRQIKTLNEERT